MSACRSFHVSGRVNRRSQWIFSGQGNSLVDIVGNQQFIIISSEMHTKQKKNYNSSFYRSNIGILIFSKNIQQN